jgi:hypothetical protein
LQFGKRTYICIQQTTKKNDMNIFKLTTEANLTFCINEVEDGIYEVTIQEANRLEDGIDIRYTFDEAYALLMSQVNYHTNN